MRAKVTDAINIKICEIYDETPLGVRRVIWVMLACATMASAMFSGQGFPVRTWLGGS